MISFKLQRFDKNILEQFSNSVKEGVLDNQSTLLLLPIKSNVRDFYRLYPELNCKAQTLEEFLEDAVFLPENLSSLSLIPNYFRIIALRQAIAELSQTERIKLFKRDSIVTENVINLIEKTKDIFKFFREYNIEQCNLFESSTLTYSGYEEEIEVLFTLEKIYYKIINSYGYYDTNQTFRDIRLNKSYLSRYKNMIVSITGVSTKYESSLLHKISTDLDIDIDIYFEYLPKHLKSVYEEIFGVNIEEEEQPKLNTEHISIINTNHEVEQFDFIKQKILGSDTPSSKTAVIIPDEKKTLFLLNDDMNIFTVTGGIPVETSKVYEFIKNIFEALISIAQNPDKRYRGKIPMDLFKHIITNKIYQQISSATDKEIKKQLDKIYSMSKIYVDPFHKEIGFQRNFIELWQMCLDILSKSESKSSSMKGNPLAIQKELLKILEFIESCIYEDLNELDKSAFNLINNRFEEIKLGLQRAPEELVGEIDLVLLAHINLSYSIEGKIGEARGEVDVIWTLGSRNVHYETVFIAFLNESNFPVKTDKDIFLNTSIRRDLKMPTYLEREELQKHYLYSLIAKSKTAYLLYTNDTSNRKSRFIDELLTNNPKLQDSSYKSRADNLVFSNKNREPFGLITKVEKTEAIVKKIKNMRFSYSRFDTYTKCSLRFYYRYILGLNDADKDEDTRLRAQHMGSELHNVLETVVQLEGGLESQETFCSNFERELKKHMYSYDSYMLNPIDNFEVMKLIKNAPRLYEQFKSRLDRGYSLHGTEEELEGSIFGLRFWGIVDRIDIGENGFEIIDYKYKKEIKQETGLKEIKDFQLLIYYMLLEKNNPKKLPIANLFYMDIKSSFSLKPYFKEVAEGDTIDGEMIESASQYLEGKILDILDIEKAFEQTDKKANCNYCDYVNICNKQVGF